MKIQATHLRGFTLIEMMVAVTIFSMVMLVSAGSILSIVDANRKAQSIKSIVNNLNFTMETMSRNIRVGTNYKCVTGSIVPSDLEVPADCPSDPGSILIVESQDGASGNVNDQLVYLFLDATDDPEGVGGIFRQIGLGNNDEDRIRLTANNVRIDEMEFYVEGALNDTDGIQPRVRMVIKGHAQVGGINSEFNLQTSVTQRVLDI